MDEVSQIDGGVWKNIVTALQELTPTPVLVLAGDWQQLQAVQGSGSLKHDLQHAIDSGKFIHIELVQHSRARSNDGDLLRFLHLCRDCLEEIAKMETGHNQSMTCGGQIEAKGSFSKIFNLSLF